MIFSRLSTQPLIVGHRMALSDAECRETLTYCSDRHWLARQKITVRMDTTGTSFHIPAEALPVMQRVRSWLREELMGGLADIEQVRVRDYRVGNGHGLHGDHYKAGEYKLLATALLYLSTPREGGETRFPGGDGGETMIPAVAGTVVAWANYLDNGDEDWRTEHESLAVKQGRKVVAIFLFYGPPTNAAGIRRRMLTASTPETQGAQ